MSQHVISRVFNTIVKTEVDMRFSSYFIGWRFQLPLLDTLELKGRRDAMFNDETLLSSVEVEDDVQPGDSALQLYKTLDKGGGEFLSYLDSDLTLADQNDEFSEMKSDSGGGTMIVKTNCILPLGLIIPVLKIQKRKLRGKFSEPTSDQPPSHLAVARPINRHCPRRLTGISEDYLMHTTRPPADQRRVFPTAGRATATFDQD
ncbi:unnamed protein product [Heligmosomoides polygyrus]|uniref:Formin_GBD_N domain-containing protein n=1 Tax=Heligmosomoides polygyrus TaxID=6339 RepID=A0A183GNC1_HELPZ|nr:unnamed protein product [Heligmosomoides polygyrus]